MTFAEAALRWFWLSARTLGWRPDEFWQATPEELVGALHDPVTDRATAPPDRDLIQAMMERDRNGR
jgi:hypothetical protein